jgi:hypothetical protein
MGSLSISFLLASSEFSEYKNEKAEPAKNKTNRDERIASNFEKSSGLNCKRPKIERPIKDMLISAGDSVNENASIAQTNTVAICIHSLRIEMFENYFA